MVTPIRELVNIQISSTTSTIQTLQMAKLPSNMDMDVDIDMIRERTALSSKNNSREFSIFS